MPAINIKARDTISPKELAKTLSMTSQMLLEYHEEWGHHLANEVTRLLWVLSNMIYAEDEDGKNMFFLDLTPFTEEA